MNWIDSSLTVLEHENPEEWKELFSRREFQLHFCLVLMFPGRDVITALLPSHIFLTEPKILPPLPAGEDRPHSVFLIWFDIEEYAFLKPLLSLLVQRGKTKLDRPLQELTATLLKHCSGPTATLLKKNLWKSCWRQFYTA